MKRLDALKPGSERQEYWDTQLPGFVLRVTPEGRKTFCILYRIAGQRRRYTLGSCPVLTLADAQTMAKNALELVRRGIDPFEEKKRKEEEERLRRIGILPFEALAERFLDEYASSLRSHYEVRRSFKKYLVPEFGKMPARELKRSVIRGFLGSMARKTPIMANRCLSYLHKMYTWALSMDLVEYNPCVGIPRPGREKQRDRVLREEELRRIWQALDSENQIRAAIFRLRLLTAQRGGEVRALRHQDIDGDWWTIPAEFSKNGLSHRVPLSPQAQGVIEQVKRLTDEPDAKAAGRRSDWVFPHPKRPENCIYESGMFALRVRTNSGVDFRAHDFRRTAASMMAAMGTPRLVLAKILNHIEPGVTQIYDRYSYDREKQEALNAWGARLSRIVSS